MKHEGLFLHQMMQLRRSHRKDEILRKPFESLVGNNKQESEDTFFTELVNKLEAAVEQSFDFQLEVFMFGQITNIYETSKLESFISQAQTTLLPENRVMMAKKLWQVLQFIAPNRDFGDKYLSEKKQQVITIWQEATKKISHPFHKTITQLELVTAVLPVHSQRMLDTAYLELEKNDPWQLGKDEKHAEALSIFIAQLPTLIHLSKNNQWQKHWHLLHEIVQVERLQYNELVYLAILKILPIMELTTDAKTQFIQKLESLPLSEAGVLEIAKYKIHFTSQKNFSAEYQALESEQATLDLLTELVARNIILNEGIRTIQMKLKQLGCEPHLIAQACVQGILRTCELGYDVPWDDQYISALIYNGAFDHELFRLIIYSRKLTRDVDSKIEYKMFNSVLADRVQFLASKLKSNQLKDEERLLVLHGLSAITLMRQGNWFPQIQLATKKDELFATYSQLEATKIQRYKKVLMKYFHELRLSSVNAQVGLLNTQLIFTHFSEFISNSGDKIGTDLSYLWFKLLSEHFSNETKQIEIAKTHWWNIILKQKNPLSRAKDMVLYVEELHLEIPQELEDTLQEIYLTLTDLSEVTEFEKIDLNNIVDLQFGLTKIEQLTHAEKLREHILQFVESEELPVQNPLNFSSLLRFIYFTDTLQQAEKYELAKKLWQKVLRLNVVGENKYSLPWITRIFLESNDFVLYEEVLFNQNIAGDQDDDFLSYEQKEILEELIHKGMKERNNALLDRARIIRGKFDDDLRNQFFNNFPWYLSAHFAAEKGVFAFDVPEVAELLESGRVDYELGRMHEIIVRFPEQIWLAEILIRRALQTIMNYNHGVDDSMDTSDASEGILFLMQK